MSSDIKYTGEPACRLASLHHGDDASLRRATQELTEKDGRVVGVRIEGFLKPSEVSSLIEHTRCLFHRRMESPSLENELSTVGISQQTGSRNMDFYFDLADAWREEPAFAQSVGENSEVLRRVIRTFETAFGTSFDLATQNGQKLLPATLRCIEYAATHKDIIGSQTRWEISRLRNDIAWNIYLNMPKHGGDLVMYPHQAGTCAKQYQVERFAPTSVRPDAGDLIFFRSGTPHGVTRSGEPDSRLTVSGCAAFEPPPESGGKYWA